ncbi:hypothetical protein LX36DRAFT_373258 [Colletotrichum falcatum]|nr:hypothetical protein LX36DRAFT_373258 [Colletotrichum falcatum]
MSRADGMPTNRLRLSFRLQGPVCQAASLPTQTNPRRTDRTPHGCRKCANNRPEVVSHELLFESPGLLPTELLHVIWNSRLPLSCGDSPHRRYRLWEGTARDGRHAVPDGQLESPFAIASGWIEGSAVSIDVWRAMATKAHIPPRGFGTGMQSIIQGQVHLRRPLRFPGRGFTANVGQGSGYTRSDNRSAEPHVEKRESDALSPSGDVRRPVLW